MPLSELRRKARLEASGFTLDQVCSLQYNGIWRLDQLRSPASALFTLQAHRQPRWACLFVRCPKKQACHQILLAADLIGTTFRDLTPGSCVDQVGAAVQDQAGDELAKPRDGGRSYLLLGQQERLGASPSSPFTFVSLCLCPWFSSVRLRFLQSFLNHG